jgi:hypothetical protein
MRRIFCPLLLALVAAAPPPAPGGKAAGGNVAFQVIDETDPQEISEDTVIYVDGHQVAHFILDRVHTAITADINLPTAPHYDYALCGRITVALPDGRQEERIVDGGATLTAVDGKLFRALAANDFSIFYLADAREESQDPPKDARHTNACSLPVS